MITFSFVPRAAEREKFYNVFNRVKEKGVSGIETIICDHLPLDEYKKYPVIGVHILYYPTWLEFWKEDMEKVKEDFYNEDGILQCFRSMDKNVLIETFKSQFEAAKELKAKYMVFHVSHVRPKDIFTFDFEYTSKEILDESIKILNEVFVGDGPLLLFENLPWPGLTLKNYEETKYFLDGVNYKNKGLLLDLSHITCTEAGMDNFQKTDEFILKKIDELKELKEMIYGMHVNGLNFSNYLKEDFTEKIISWKTGDREQKFSLEFEYMKNVDPHLVYRGNLKKIIEKLPNIKNITLELSFTSLENLEEVINEQLKYLK